MSDLSQDVVLEVAEARLAQAIAEPTQAIDSTTILVKRLAALRGETVDNDDLNTAIGIVLPD